MARKLLLRDLPEELRRIVVDVRRLLEGFGSIPGTRQEPFNSKRFPGATTTCSASKVLCG